MWTVRWNTRRNDELYRGDLKRASPTEEARHLNWFLNYKKKKMSGQAEGRARAKVLAVKDSSTVSSDGLCS